MKLYRCPYDGWQSEGIDKNDKMYCNHFSTAGGTLHGEICMEEMKEWKEVTDLPAKPEFRRSLPADFFDQLESQAIVVMARGFCVHSVHMQGCGPCEAHAQYMDLLSKLREGAALIRETCEGEWDDACFFDHHGYCQQHGDFSEPEIGCHLPRAKKFIESLEGIEVT